MPTYEPADDSVLEMASEILSRYASHSPLVKSGVKFDFVFAHPTVNEHGEPTGDAIKKHGVKALGLCRIINLKDRTMGRGDVEILIDYEWWTGEASEQQQAALLDHELHHAEVKMKDGQVKRDALGRPLIRLRKHDAEFGWFDIIALRHGKHSQERIQAKKLADDVGQLYWPDLCGEVTKEMKAQITGRVASFKEFTKTRDAGATVSIATGGKTIYSTDENHDVPTP